MVRKITAFPLIFVLVLLMMLTAAQAGPFSSDPAAVEEAGRSVLRLTLLDGKGRELGTGSGFVMFDGRTLVTNCHVIEGVRSIMAEDDGAKNKYRVSRVLVVSKRKDIAILQFETDTGLMPLRPFEGELRRSEHVWAIGYPLGLQDYSVSDGIISAFVRDRKQNRIRFTAALSSGSSGGALFNDDGAVIGVTTGTLATAGSGYISQMNNFAAHIDDVLTLYRSWDGQTTYALKNYSKAEYREPTPTPQPTPVPTPTPPVWNYGPDAAYAIDVDQTVISLSVRDTLQLHASCRALQAGAPSSVPFLWTSSDTRIARISDSGTVTAVAAGDAVIMCISAEDPDIFTRVFVHVSAVTAQKLQAVTKSPVTIAKGKTKKLTVRILPEHVTSTKLKWTSSDRKIATVDGKGNVKALKKGKCTITAETTDGSRLKVSFRIVVSTGRADVPDPSIQYRTAHRIITPAFRTALPGIL